MQSLQYLELLLSKCLSLLSLFPMMDIETTIIFLLIFLIILFGFHWIRKHKIKKTKTYIIEIKDASKYIDKRVELKGWIQHIRKRSKKLWFLELRDGTAIPPSLSCILYGDLCKTKQASLLTVESSVIIYGIIKKRKVTQQRTVHKQIKKKRKKDTQQTEETKIHKKKTMKGDTRTIELQIDDIQIIGHSLSDITKKFRKDSSPQIQLDQRHLMIRHETLSSMLKMRCYVIQSFREYFYKKRFIEITPPTLVQTQCEGGGDLFKLERKYDDDGKCISIFDEKDVYLSQTSQLYLETCLSSLKKVFSIMPSYRAEKSKTRRHLAEYTHIEAEISFIKFYDLLDIMEEIIVDVCQQITSKHSELLQFSRKLHHEQWPKDEREELREFKIPKRPFRRITHEEAIEFCQEHGIKKLLVDDDGKPIVDDYGKEQYVALEKGEDIPEKPEREMIDKIGEPVFLIKFASSIKPWYMSSCIVDGRDDLTESVDLLMPGVGEIIGGSMREYDYDKLQESLEQSDITDISLYDWYSDIRKYGSVPHGGFGLGLERFLCWILHIHHIRDATLYPRYAGRCTP